MTDPQGVVIRRATVDDHAPVVAVVNEWWGGRQIQGLVQPLFLEHFSATSLVAETSSGELVGFLIGFVSADDAREAYVHFAGVAPAHRGGGLGRELYERFDAIVAPKGVRRVRCVTSVVNAESVAFHGALGFAVDGHSADAGGDGGEYVQLSRSVAPTPSPPRGEAVWPPDAVTVLAGSFVEVRPTTLDDSAGLFAALNADAVWTHLTIPRPATPAQMRTIVEASLASMHPWTVRLREATASGAAGDIVGWSSYLEVSPRDARLEIGSTAYAPDVWASQVNPETKLLLLGHAFDGLGFGRVQLKTDVRNTRSQDAIWRLGATREGLLRLYQRRLDGSVRDTAVFSITVDEWPAVRAGLRARLAG